MNKLVLSSGNLPVPAAPDRKPDENFPRLLKLRQDETKLDETERRELAVLEREMTYANVMDSQFTVELSEIRIVAQNQLFLNTATNETVKKIKGVVLFSHLVRVYWPTDEDKEKLPADFTGPLCTSLDCKTGEMKDPKGGEAQSLDCDVCPFNKDNRAQHPETAGRCKQNQRVLFFAKTKDGWAPMPVMLRLPQSSVKPFSQFYRHHFHNEGRTPTQIVVELTLEKRTFSDKVYSVVKVEQAQEPIDSIEVLERLQDFRDAYGSAANAPVSQKDYETNFDTKREDKPVQAELDPTKEVSAEG